MMKVTFQHITGAVIGGAVLGLFFYALGAHDGRQDAVFKAAQTVTHAIQNRAGINETIGNLDSVALCLELGGVGAMMFISIVAASIGGAFATFGRKLWAVIAG